METQEVIWRAQEAILFIPLSKLERKGAASAKLRSYSVKATVVSACEIKAPPVGVAWSERNCR